MRFLLDRVKLIIGAAVAVLGAIFGFIFVSRGEKIDKLEDELKQEKINSAAKEKQSKETEKSVETEKKIAIDSIEIANNEDKKIKKIKKKIDDNPDDEEYEVML